MAFLYDGDLQKKEGEKMLRSEVYRMYDAYCTENDRQAIGKSKFQDYMKRKGYPVKRCADGQYYYMNIGVADKDFVSVDDTVTVPFENIKYEQTTLAIG